MVVIFFCLSLGFVFIYPVNGDKNEIVHITNILNVLMMVSCTCVSFVCVCVCEFQPKTFNHNKVICADVALYFNVKSMLPLSFFFIFLCRVLM